MRRAEIEHTAQGRVVHLHLHNADTGLAFQVSAAARTQSGGLIAPVYWSDNWIELKPGEEITLTAELPEERPPIPPFRSRAGTSRPSRCTRKPPLQPRRGN